MKIYVRKILNHDITHEVSLTTNIVSEFFDGKISFNMYGKNSNQKGIVTINSATDPRFGGEFKNLLKYEGGVIENDIIVIYKYNDYYKIEIILQNDERYNAIKNITFEDIRHTILYKDENEMLLDETEEYMKEVSELTKEKGAYNKIYYGVPGCGKSYSVKKEFNESKYHIERTTFHPEYTNSDFIGQIIPKLIDDKVSYEFHVGAFTKSLEYAIKNPNKKICLIVEEINRGNSSSIFGDIFQLLDRDENGTSKYSIFNGPVIDYLNSVGVKVNSITIPSNMWIVATMNTCDQNVFTLDTAFKRRWKMEYIKNIFSDDEESKKIKNTKLPFNGKYKNITWGEFVTKVNKHILEDKSGINGEDKQLGMYFVSYEEINSQKEFAEKVLSYLWEDVAKFNPQYWFGDIESYDELLKTYENSYLKVFDSLFDEEIKISDDYNAIVENMPIGE